MGLGTPPQMLEMIARGIDMFDCVLPTRLARNGTAFTSTGTLNLKNAEFALQKGPIEEGCACPACAEFSRGYIRHLIKAEEILGLRLITLHNLHFYLDLMKEAREAYRGAEPFEVPAGICQPSYKTRDNGAPRRPNRRARSCGAGIDRRRRSPDLNRPLIIQLARLSVALNGGLCSVRVRLAMVVSQTAPHFFMLTFLIAQAPPPTPAGGILSFRAVHFHFRDHVFRPAPPADETAKGSAAVGLGLKTGDRVVTNAGIHGLISNVKETTVIVKVADNVKIEMEKSAIATVLKSSERNFAPLFKMSPAATFFCRPRPAHLFRVVFRDRSRTAETPPRHHPHGAAGSFQHRHDLAAGEKDRARSRYSGRHFIPDPPGERRQRDHQGDARPGGRSHPQARRLFRRRRTGHHSGR